MGGTGPPLQAHAVYLVAAPKVEHGQVAVTFEVGVFLAEAPGHGRPAMADERGNVRAVDRPLRSLEAGT